MTKQSLLLTLPLLLCNFLTLGATKDSPNILFILTNDQRHQTMCAYPETYDWAHTPNVDELAESGLRFSHAYMSS